jgi:hypothetical protein
MSRQAIFSTPTQLTLLGDILSKYSRLPFSHASIPGAVLEGALAHVRSGEVLNTYDFVDVIKRDAGCGWQVKSTMATTPVTWKRAKIPDSVALIASSQKSSEGVQTLGSAIIKFCNDHAIESLRLYDLHGIGYSRLIIFPNGRVVYFEKLLCTRATPNIFNPTDFEWRWSTPKRTVKKEQLPALHGFHRPTGKKWWAWHGLGENQLHFSGESNWWPDENDPHVVTFSFPTAEDRIELERFIELLARLDA